MVARDSAKIDTEGQRARAPREFHVDRIGSERANLDPRPKATEAHLAKTGVGWSDSAVSRLSWRNHWGASRMGHAHNES